MPIGLSEYSVQIYELYNGGDTTATVDIDDSLLEDLVEQNFSRPILKCMSPKTFAVLPGSTYETKWKFSPIEAKTYQVDVSFKVNGSKISVVTFKLIGYDKRKLNNMSIQREADLLPDKQTYLLPNQVNFLFFFISIRKERIK